MKNSKTALGRQLSAERQRRAKIHRACLEMVEETLSEGNPLGCTADTIARACAYVLCDNNMDVGHPLDKPFDKPLNNGYDDHASFIAAVCDDYLDSYESTPRGPATAGPNIVKARRLMSLSSNLTDS